MRRFFCHCGDEVALHDHVCKGCGRDLAYDPKVGTMWSGELFADYKFIAHANDEQKHLVKNLVFRSCEHRQGVVGCNWLLMPTDENCQCISCRTTRIIPDQSTIKNQNRWFHLERAKRQLFQTLIDLRIVDSDKPDLLQTLKFDFLEDKRSNPELALEFVLTGHCNGVITLNAAEADEGFLHTMKEQMRERYRTLLGHFRHEIGHYFWTLFFDKPVYQQEFRDVFGDEREDYGMALERYYQEHKQAHWRARFITPYASSHPHEDWAETWAHYMHIVDTLQTAQSFGLSVFDPSKHDFDNWFAEWRRVTQVMNALNRSMGVAEPYPFTVSDMVAGKLRFIDETVNRYSDSIADV